MAETTAPKAHLLEKDPRDLHHRQAAYIKAQTGYDADVKTVQLLLALHGEYQRSDENQLAIQKAKEAKETADAARKAKASEPKPAKAAKAPAEKATPAAKPAATPAKATAPKPGPAKKAPAKKATPAKATAGTAPF